MLLKLLTSVCTLSKHGHHTVPDTGFLRVALGLGVRLPRKNVLEMRPHQADTVAAFKKCGFWSTGLALLFRRWTALALKTRNGK